MSRGPPLPRALVTQRAVEEVGCCETDLQVAGGAGR